MHYECCFKQRVDGLRTEGRSQVFEDMERRYGRFPRAFDHRVGGEVTVWWTPRHSDADIDALVDAMTEVW